MNRLELAIENPTNPTAAPSLWSCGDTPGQRWCQQYGYDTRGNRTVTARLGLTADLGGEPTAFDSKNHMTGGAWQNDGRGNVKKNLYATPETPLSEELGSLRERR